MKEFIKVEPNLIELGKSLESANYVLDKMSQDIESNEGILDDMQKHFILDPIKIASAMCWDYIQKAYLELQTIEEKLEQ